MKRGQSTKQNGRQCGDCLSVGDTTSEDNRGTIFKMYLVFAVREDTEK
jgi:hypothetical protein